MNAEVENVLFTSLVACKKAFSDEQETAPAALAEEATRRQHKKEYMRVYMRRYRSLLKEKASKKHPLKKKASKKVPAKAKAAPKASPKVTGHAATTSMTKGTDQQLQ